MKFQTVSVTVLASVALACNSTPSELLDSPSQAVTTERESVATSSIIPGYVHSTKCSKFAFGGATAERVDGSVTRVTGNNGVFATNRVTGAARAILNAGAMPDLRPPFSQSPEANKARALKYFADCGLPSDQIADVQAFALMSSSGLTSDGVKSAQNPSLAGYTTIIHRAIDGVIVPDSFAAVRFNADDEVTMEWVFWPNLPVAALTEAKAIQARLADPTAGKALFTRLPQWVSSSQREVTIRHSDFADESPFSAFGSLDAHLEPSQNNGLRGGTRNFDIEGTERIHPNRRMAERESTHDTVARRAR